MGPGIVIFEVGRKHAVGGKYGGRGRYDHLLNLKLPGNFSGLQTRSASEGHHGEPAGVHAALYRHQPDALGNGRGDHCGDTFSRLDHRKAKWLGHVLGHGCLSQGSVQLRVAAQEISCV